MAARGEHSYREITTQAESWRGALRAVEARRTDLAEALERNRDREQVFVGCGSTHYLAQFAAPYFQSVAGRRCRGVPSSELALQTDTLVPPGGRPLVVALSRSGETSETLMAVEAMRARGAEALAVTCYGDSPLGHASDAVVEIPEGREESYAQTRSFAGMLVATQALAALAAGEGALLSELRRLPDLAGGLIERAEPVAERFGTDESVKRITYLGSGALYGLASEATVKMKEMSLSMAEPYHFMEFRHGPMSLVDGEHLVVGLLSDAVRDYELGVLRDLRARGARVLAVANEAPDVAGEFDGALSLGAPLPERARAVLYLPLLQLMAYHRAMARGLNPDRPRNVVMAIKLDGTQLGP